jgi:hypothetical protein
MANNDPTMQTQQATGYFPQFTANTTNPVSVGQGGTYSQGTSSEKDMYTTAGPYTVGTAVPGTGSPPPQQYAPPIDVGYNGNVPGMGENVSAALLGHYSDSGVPGVSNNAQGAYDSFNSSTPANMGAYYDNASRNSANAINTQMAARGSYGSSNAIGVLGNAETNLRAQQAKDEAGYGLQRASMKGSLASAADNSSQAASANERNWVGALSDLGFRNQQQGMSRYQQGNDNAFRGAQAASDIEGDVGGAAIAAQQDLLVQSLMAQSGMTFDQATAAANQANQARTDANQSTQDMVQGINGVTKAYNAYNDSKNV